MARAYRNCKEGRLSSTHPADVGRDAFVAAYRITAYKEILDTAKVAAYAELAGPTLRSAGGAVRDMRIVPGGGVSTLRCRVSMRASAAAAM